MGVIFSSLRMNGLYVAPFYPLRIGKVFIGAPDDNRAQKDQSDQVRPGHESIADIGDSPDDI